MFVFKKSVRREQATLPLLSPPLTGSLTNCPKISRLPLQMIRGENILRISPTCYSGIGKRELTDPGGKSAYPKQAFFGALPLSRKISAPHFSKVYAKKEKVSLKDKQVVSITYEEIGFFPRSFGRVFDRFIKQLFSDVENLVIQEYRFYRYLFLTTVKCVFILLFVPFLVNLFSKNYIIRPLTEYCWNQQQNEIFLNSYQQKHAFVELQNFEEKIYFESLVIPKNEISKTDHIWQSHNGKSLPHLPPSSYTSLAQGGSKGFLQEKTIQLAIDYNNASIEAISCMFADLISLSVFGWLLLFMEVQISVSRLFILEVFFGLDDTKKSLIILLVTDLLVGYHSVGPWSILFESLFNRYGLPNSQAAIYLLTGSLPVIMDVFFKYLIFRHLNRASPASVATYHAMIE